MDPGYDGDGQMREADRRRMQAEGVRYVVDPSWPGGPLYVYSLVLSRTVGGPYPTVADAQAVADIWGRYDAGTATADDLAFVAESKAVAFRRAGYRWCGGGGFRRATGLGVSYIGSAAR